MVSYFSYEFKNNWFGYVLLEGTMKIKKGFIINKFAGKYIAVSTCDFGNKANVLVTLNNTGAFVWELLENDMSYNEVLSRLMEKYDVDVDTARADLDSFLHNVRKADLLDE